VKNVRWTRRTNAFYTWLRLYIPGTLIKTMTDGEFEAAIEADAHMLEISHDVLKDLLMIGRQVRTSEEFPTWEFVLGVVTPLVHGGRHLRESSQIIKFLRIKVSELYQAGLQKEAQIASEGRGDLLEMKRAAFFGEPTEISRAAAAVELQFAENIDARREDKMEVAEVAWNRSYLLNEHMSLVMAVAVGVIAFLVFISGTRSLLGSQSI
jgi:hypothetical protein